MVFAKCSGFSALMSSCEIEVFLETAGFIAGADVLEGAHLAATDRTAEAEGIQVVEGCIGSDTQLLHALGGVVHVAAAAALKTMAGRIAGLINLGLGRILRGGVRPGELVLRWVGLRDVAAHA